MRKLKCECGDCGTCFSRIMQRALAEVRVKKPGRKPRCVCGKCRLCKCRAYNRKLRARIRDAKRWPDLDLFLPSGIKSTLDPANWNRWRG